MLNLGCFEMIDTNIQFDVMYSVSRLGFCDYLNIFPLLLLIYHVSEFNKTSCHAMEKVIIFYHLWFSYNASTEGGSTRHAMQG